MTTVVFKKLNRKVKQSKKRVYVKSVRDANGGIVRVVDAGSRTLPTDIQYVFSRNVRKARKENKKTLGSDDLVPPNA